jgi:hypothetical protein
MTHARTLTGAVVTFFVLSISGYTSAQTVKCTTWNLQWFPNGSVHEAPATQQDQRIKEAADVLRPINPDVILLQEMRDYDVCARLGEAIAPGIYHVAICSAFKEPFQSGLGKQQVAILSKYQAQAAEAKAQAREAKALQSRGATLQHCVERVEDKLFQADTQLDQLKAKVRYLREHMVDGWGAVSPSSNVPVISPPDYREVLALEAAIADYESRVHQILVERVATAKAELKEFQLRIAGFN